MTDFCIYSFLIILAGFPAITRLSSGNDLVTMLPAPITQLLPILTDGRITAFVPIHTLFPIMIGLLLTEFLILESILQNLLFQVLQH
jgi:pheromone shutdown protein TraB